MKIEFHKATILTGRGPDKVMLTTEYREACYPYDGKLMLDFTAAQGSGATYLKNHFGLTDHDIEIVELDND